MTYNLTGADAAKGLSFGVAVEERSLPQIFDFFNCYNAQPVELRSTLYPTGMMKFLYIEAGLQTSGEFAGKYVGRAIFEKQEVAGAIELRKPWLPLLFLIFPGDN